MKRAYKIIFLIIVLEITDTYSIQHDDDYCHIETCQNAGPHTGCNFTLGKLGNSCSDNYEITSATLSDKEKLDIVRRHNELRRYVAAGRELRGNPGPQPNSGFSFMSILEWDDELALLAQTWANQCIPNVDSCRDVDRFKVNQIQDHYMSGDTGRLLNVTEFINNWYDRVQYFDNRTVSNYTYDENTSYYSQIVWARTRRIGCGQITLGKKRTTHNNGTHHLRVLPLENTHYARIFVCNYGPGGNVNGERVYYGNSRLIRIFP